MLTVDRMLEDQRARERRVLAELKRTHGRSGQPEWLVPGGAWADGWPRTILAVALFLASFASLMASGWLRP